MSSPKHPAPAALLKEGRTRITSTNEVDASSLLASGGGGDVESVCYLCLDVGEESLRRDCACRGSMPDLSTSPALLNMQKQKVFR